MGLAKSKPAPFDVVLIDDTSRLSRNLEDALRLSSTYHGIVLVSVSQGINTEQESMRSMFVLAGLFDEQYVQGIAQKVHRGQEGKVIRGFVAGGRCFGYQRANRRSV
jgi:DNA invertase Pin-like site-specific DNA recombinase